MHIEPVWYRIFFNFILFTQLVNCGPQRGYAGNPGQNRPGGSWNQGSYQHNPDSLSNDNSIQNDSNRSSTERIVQGNSDGSTTERIVQYNPDGSSTERIIRHNPDGSTTEEPVQGDPDESPDRSPSQENPSSVAFVPSITSAPPVTSVGGQSSEPSQTDILNCHVCTISLSSVSLYYWPQKSTNTACLATISPPPSPTMPSGLNPISPSAYAIFFSVTVNNDCDLTTSFPTSIASFHQDSLSTLDEKGKAQSFNLADLPCPPSSIKLKPGQRYMPNFAWNHELFFGHNFEPFECKTMTGLNAWPDPPIAFTTVTGGLEAPTAGALPRGRVRREPADAPVTSWIPGATLTAV